MTVSGLPSPPPAAIQSHWYWEVDVEFRQSWYSWSFDGVQGWFINSNSIGHCSRVELRVECVGIDGGHDFHQDGDHDGGHDDHETVVLCGDPLVWSHFCPSWELGQYLLLVEIVFKCLPPPFWFSENCSQQGNTLKSIMSARIVWGQCLQSSIGSDWGLLSL